MIIRPEEQLPTIAIVGRTNVGKSTLFNRLLEKHKAMVSPEAGTTRSSNIGITRWRGERLRVIDTGGLDFYTDRVFEADIKKQIVKAARQAGLLIFLVDLQSGLLPQEKRLKSELGQLKLPVLLVGNKGDSPALRHQALEPEWRKLGLGAPLPVSAINGSGVGDMLDAAIKLLKNSGQQTEETGQAPIKVCLLGKPNVGKSTLFNALIGEEQAMVSPLPLTTRESNDTLIIKDDQPYLFVDTAGVRAATRIAPGLEKFSVRQALHSLAHSDIVLLVLDPRTGLGTQDKHLAGLVAERQKALIIIINKWDLFLDQPEANRAKITRDLNFHFPFLNFAPVLFTSGQTGKNVEKIYELIKEVNAAYQKTIPQEELNKFMEVLIKRHRPTKGKGVRHPKIYSLTQVSVKPPTFKVTIKQKTSLHESYLRFIQNQLREEFDLIGVPVVVYAKKVRV